MAFTAENLAADDRFLAAILHCATQLLAIYRESPRIASIFAAQQRWLMAHAGFALHYGHPDDGQSGGLYSGRFVDFAVKNDIASRKTAAAFMQEMLAYRFLRVVPGPDKRTRYLEPTEIAEQHFTRWLVTHMMILDSLDGGERADQITAAPSATMAAIQPRIARAIIGSESVRNPGPTFNLFNWANSGGLVMDYLISRLPQFPRAAERVVIGPLSLRELREQFMISNTHLKRLLTQAATMESVGWTEPSRKGDFWLSRRFILEYWNYQAAKFAIVDAAAEAVLGPAVREEPQARRAI
ncbi:MULTISPECIES: hypothetical protein [Rhizobium]|uniref:hypothetical protein n=1 Tax=Rhizobium TaxID=379 RepID=UPI0007E96826|nr:MULTISPECIES: hypothetical protein [Rhizobium]ANK92520.1 hypothetical protein AMK01_CH03087 [Rhizobium sp. N6212]ANK98560.1 hypothetical protein AMK00_CH03090 [Rhizobium sp. N621]ANL04690.1 hypothetical protein AMJ99_CH03168 [Rhizobium esperanzae]ANL10751.1 hypothetical protein AMJ98_CH03117 [Rhizobium sp. N1341]ANL22804.1 hypothetical protein AMJ96_CH03120 [Rhizobium sp. N113]